MKLTDNLKHTRWCVSVLLFSISLLSGLAILIMVLYIASYLSPVDANARPIQLKIARGMSSQAIATKLAQKDLIHHPWTFLLAAHLSGVTNRLQVGSYRLSGSMSIPQIIDHLKAGKVITHQLVIPEGLTVADVGELWEKGGFGTTAAFNEAASSPTWQRSYNIEAETLEGYLFPNTYQFPDGAPAETLIQTMLDEFDRRWTAEMSDEAKALGFSRHEIITLASIIEAEARVADERPLISSVFHNRLGRGWKLQADPTALYGVGNPDRPPTAADLRINSPYNTYLHKGLPPGPICNPGIASILAALRPASADYMYFVAIGGGKHYFSKTLREHRNMINKVRRNRRSITD